MKKLKRTNIFLTVSIIAFLFVEAYLGLLFQISESGRYHYFGFALVMLACLFCTVFFDKSKRYACTQAALVFTVIADYFLVIKDEHYTLAVVMFMFAQGFYMLRIFSEQGEQAKKLHAVIRASVSVIAAFLPLLVLGKDSDILSTVSVVYYANLILNTAFAFILSSLDKKALLFSIGLLLFVGCDLFVGLGNLSSYIEIPTGSVIDKLLSSKLNIAWIFYTPSQALLSISLLPYGKSVFKKCNKTKNRDGANRKII